jgi:gas vesicle protein
MGQKDYELRGQSAHQTDEHGESKIQDNLRSRVHQAQEIGREKLNQGKTTLRTEMDHLKQGEVRKAPILMSSAGIMMLVFGLVIGFTAAWSFGLLGRYSRYETLPLKDKSQIWFEENYRKFENLYASTADDLRDKVDNLYEYMKKKQIEQSAVVSKTKEKGYERLNQWVTDLKSYRDSLSSDVGDVQIRLGEWKDRLNTMRTEGFETFLNQLQMARARVMGEATHAKYSLIGWFQSIKHGVIRLVSSRAVWLLIGCFVALPAFIYFYQHKFEHHNHSQ